jgi:non-homologous end joining protein Ku
MPRASWRGYLRLSLVVLPDLPVASDGADETH